VNLEVRSLAKRRGRESVEKRGREVLVLVRGERNFWVRGENGGGSKVLGEEREGGGFVSSSLPLFVRYALAPSPRSHIHSHTIIRVRALLGPPYHRPVPVEHPKPYTINLSRPTPYTLHPTPVTGYVKEREREIERDRERDQWRGGDPAPEP
jgi:hypothetical protein